MRSHTETCVPASSFQTAQDAPPKRDPDLLVVSCLSPSSLTSEDTDDPAAPESSFASVPLHQWLSDRLLHSSDPVLQFARLDVRNDMLT